MSAEDRALAVSHVLARCADNTGRVIYVEAYFIDRGEPGINDAARIFMTYDPAFAGDPDNDPNAFIDAGKIQEGNIQIHPTHTAIYSTT